MKNSIWTKRLLRSFLPFCLFTFLPLSVAAQDEWIVKGDCTPGLNDEAGTTRGLQRHLPAINKNWDPNRIYRQMVILVSYKDCDFLMPDARATYDSIFNCNGYNQGVGVGCVADYFRDQSNGQFNLQFDVYGPIKIDTLACPYSNPNSNTRNFGRPQLEEATQMLFEQYPDISYSEYDWNGNGSVNQVVYVCAGYAGNQGSKGYGYIWPNTSTLNNTLKTPDGLYISNYTVSAERWTNNRSFGIGTICHEFSHSLGLPDIYPTSSSAGFSVLDEWDLMDGGNFTNYGWSPASYTPMEKYLMGWLDFVDLTGPATIKDMKPSTDGGEVYRIKHTENEWLLLENRQHLGWDLGVPGRGLVIYHAQYDKTSWSGNSVNNNKDKRRYELVNADNLDYAGWDVVFYRNYDAGLVKNPWRNPDRMNSYYLSTSPYPWTTDSTDFVNAELTDSSVPSARMNGKNAQGSLLLGKPITNIRMSDDGLISFDFMGGDPNAISVVTYQQPTQQYYNLQGQQVAVPRKGVFILNRKKIIIH